MIEKKDIVSKDKMKRLSNGAKILEKLGEGGMGLTYKPDYLKLNCLEPIESSCRLTPLGVECLLHKYY